MLAWCGGEFLHLFKREKLNLGVLPFDFFEEVVDVLPQEFLLIRLFEQCPERGPVPGDGVVGELALSSITTATFKEVSLKFLAELLVDLADGAFSLAEIGEMFLDDFPLLIFLETLLPEVFKKVDAEFLFVEKPELLVEQLLKAAAADGLRLFYHRGVELSLTGICRMPVEIYAQSLAATQTVGVRVADGRVEVEVERYAVARYFLLAEEYFCAGIHCILSELKVWCKVR